MIGEYVRLVVAPKTCRGTKTDRPIRQGNLELLFHPDERFDQRISDLWALEAEVEMCPRPTDAEVKWSTCCAATRSCRAKLTFQPQGIRESRLQMDQEAFAKLEKYAFEQVPCYCCFSGEDGTLFHMYGQTWATCGCASCRFKRLIVSLKDKPDMEIEEPAFNDSPSPETKITTLRDALISARHGLRLMELINSVAYDDNRFREKREAIVSYLKEQSKSFEAALTDQGQPLPSDADLARKFRDPTIIEVETEG